MSRRIEDHQIRKLIKTGRGASIYATLPIEIVRELKWRAGQKVVIKKKGQGIFISDWPACKKKKK